MALKLSPFGKLISSEAVLGPEEATWNWIRKATYSLVASNGKGLGMLLGVVHKLLWTRNS